MAAVNDAWLMKVATTLGKHQLFMQSPKINLNDVTCFIGTEFQDL